MASCLGFRDLGCRIIWFRVYGLGTVLPHAVAIIGRNCRKPGCEQLCFCPKAPCVRSINFIYQCLVPAIRSLRRCCRCSCRQQANLSLRKGRRSMRRPDAQLSLNFSCTTLGWYANSRPSSQRSGICPAACCCIHLVHNARL